MLANIMESLPPNQRRVIASTFIDAALLYEYGMNWKGVFRVASYSAEGTAITGRGDANEI